jgi:type IV secretory pathway TraG/TraD family ATPase VirD4
MAGSFVFRWVRSAAHRAGRSRIVTVPLTAAAGVFATLLSFNLPMLGQLPFTLGHLAVGAGLSLGTCYAVGCALTRNTTPSSVHQRGAVVTRYSQQKQSADVANASDLALAGVPIAAADETKHFKFIGTTGTGKSTAIAQLLEGALARGDRAVIADPDGGYLRRFYDAKRGDVILNPFDQRSLKWDLFAEIRREYDIDQLARSLLPDNDGDDIWRGYGRTFFSAVTAQARTGGITDVRELHRLLTMADAGELRTLTHGTPAQAFLEPDNARMFHSIHSVTSSAVASLKYVADQQAPSFSIRQWIERDRPEGGVLFIPYRAGQIAALRSQISAWMRIAIFAAMERSDEDHHLWFVIDELDALGSIDGLKDALARIRKFGGRCVLGLQSIAQVASTYGAGEAHTIVENCGNTFIFRCSASEGGGTSRFASTLIGQREVRRRVYSFSQRHTEVFGSSTSSEHTSVEPAVMDSQIEQIPDLCGYLKLASRPEWLMVGLSPPTSVERSQSETPAFVPISMVTAAMPVPAMKKETVPKRRARAKAPSADTAAAPASTLTTARTKRTPRVPRTNGASAASRAPRAPDSRGFEP